MMITTGSLASTCPTPNGCKAQGEESLVQRSMDEEKASQATNSQDCAVCDRKVAEYDFPTEPPTKNCEHDMHTCKKCLREWIAFPVENETLDRIACPECQSIIQRDDVEAHGSGETFKRQVR